MAEEWREIPNTDYSVSSEGRVASRWFGKWRVLKGSRNAYGYSQVGLHDGRGGVRTTRVHILVAAAFLGPKPTPLHQINHKNGIKTDNRVVNLEWVTQSQNVRHSYDVLGNKSARGERVGTSKVTEAEVREIIRRCAAGESQTGVAADYGISQMNVSLIVRRQSWAWLK